MFCKSNLSLRYAEDFLSILVILVIPVVTVILIVLIVTVVLIVLVILIILVIVFHNKKSFLNRLCIVFVDR